MPDLVLSTSSVSEYLRCHHRYLLNHVYRRKGRQNMAAAIGQAVHAGVERLLSNSPLRPVEALRAAFAHEVASVPADEIAADPAALTDAETMLGVYTREVAPRFHPTLVEAPFTVRVEDIILSGTIDGADDSDLRDLKTTSGKTINGRKPNFEPASYDLQLSLYALGYQGLTGRRPKRLILDVLTRRGTYRQYVRPPAIGDAIDVLAVARDGIMREEFDPNGALSGACNWCPFVGVCEHAVVRD